MSASKLVMPFASLETALRIASQFERMAVLQSPDGHYVVTTTDHVKTLKREGYTDVPEVRS